MKTALIEKKGDRYEARLWQDDGKFVIQHARKGPLIEYCRMRDFDTILDEPVSRLFMLAPCTTGRAL